VDIKCVVCGELWDAWGVRHGDMLPWESKLFRQGAGCPSCEGVPNGWTPNTLSDVENGDEDPMARIVAMERVADGTKPAWVRPADPMHWKCDACGVEVITDLDACVQDGAKASEVLKYCCPFPFDGNRYKVEHYGDPEKTPAHVFGDPTKVDVTKVCEFCLEKCYECDAPLCGKLSNDTYDGLASFPHPANEYRHVVCVDCLYKVENEEANRVWADCYTASERIAYMRKHRSQFDCLYTKRPLCERWADILANVRGKSFGGYASEIL
jgi:hypothetical protein